MRYTLIMKTALNNLRVPSYLEEGRVLEEE
jgi:hypothetical protein